MKHFEEAMKALDSGDTNGAIMHLQFAEKVYAENHFYRSLNNPYPFILFMILSELNTTIPNHLS